MKVSPGGPIFGHIAAIATPRGLLPPPLLGGQGVQLFGELQLSEMLTSMAIVSQQPEQPWLRSGFIGTSP